MGKAIECYLLASDMIPYRVLPKMSVHLSDSEYPLEMTMAYSRWNKSNKSYDNVSEESLYRMNDANITIAFISTNEVERLLASN